MWGKVRERRATERRTDQAARLAREHEPQLVAALRQLAQLVAEADQPRGPSKADSIAAMKRLYASLPAEVLALVRPQ